MNVVVKRKIRTIAAMALTLSLMACSGRARIAPGVIPPPVSVSHQEQLAAENALVGFASENSFHEVKGGAELVKVRKIVAKLAKAAGMSPSDLPVHLVDAGEEVNAMAFNDASILVYTGLVKKVRSEDELAVVLSHEIAHILGKHSSEESAKESRGEVVSAGSSLLGLVAGAAASAAGFDGLADLAESVTRGATDAIGYGAFVGKFDRDQEYEADQVGLMLMAKAGYNPDVAISFWARAEEVFNQSDSEIGAFFSTHPSFDDRKEALEEVLPLAMKAYGEKKLRKA